LPRRRRNWMLHQRRRPTTIHLPRVERFLGGRSFSSDIQTRREALTARGEVSASICLCSPRRRRSWMLHQRRRPTTIHLPLFFPSPLPLTGESFLDTSRRDTKHLSSCKSNKSASLSRHTKQPGVSQPFAFSENLRNAFPTAIFQINCVPRPGRTCRSTHLASP
jgi:hypothetical protein